MATNDGGSAFPRPPVLHEEGGVDSFWTQYPEPGMSYRRWLAGQALVGEIASLSTMEAAEALAERMIPGETAEEHVARLCWRLADAMIRTENEVLDHCDDCAGTGGSDGEKCPECNGTGLTLAARAAPPSEEVQ